MFAYRLKKLREEKGLSMDKLIILYNKTYSAKMNKSTLSRYENGSQKPNYIVVVNLANFFNVSTDYLTGSEKRTDDATYDNTDNQDTLTSSENHIIETYRQLNTEGQTKLTDYADDLVSSGKYKPYKKVELKKPHKLIAFGGDNEDTTYHGTKIDKKPKIT